MTEPNGIGTPEDFLEQLGLGDLPAERKAELTDTMGRTLMLRMINRVMDRLSADDVKVFDRLIASGDEARINAFLSQKVPNIAELTQEIIEEFKEESREDVAMVRRIVGETLQKFPGLAPTDPEQATSEEP
jgi:hypothetical protein